MIKYLIFMSLFGCVWLCRLSADAGVAVTVRGQAQEISAYRGSSKAKTAVLFLPGDGGWRGFAIDMARSLAASGFDVFGWDIKKYLMGFTNGTKTLSEAEIQADIANICGQIRGLGYQNVVMVGWSQGAAMAALAAGQAHAGNWLDGIVLLGLPESAVLGWRFADNLTYITKGEPNEPHFQTKPWLPKIAPVRAAMIQSTADEYISLETSRQLYGLLREPKRFETVVARNHRYDGNQEQFLRVLTELTAWAGGKR